MPIFYLARVRTILWKPISLYSGKGKVEIELERWSVRGKDNQPSGLISVLTRSTFALQLDRTMLRDAFPFHPDIPQMASGVPEWYVWAQIGPWGF